MPANARDEGSIPGWGRSPGEGSGNPLQYSWDFSCAHSIKNLPAMQETWVQSLGQEDLLEKEVVTHSSILAWRIPWTEQPGGLQSTGLQRVGHDWATSLTSHTIKGLSNILIMEDFFNIDHLQGLVFHVTYFKKHRSGLKIIPDVTISWDVLFL